MGRGRADPAVGDRARRMLSGGSGTGDRGIMQDIDAIRAKYLGQIGEASDEAAIEAVRVAALGKKGEISLMMRRLGGMTPEERKTAGPAFNALRDEGNAAIAARKAAPAAAALEERRRAEWLDVTLSPRPALQRSIHPTSQVM